jgi:GMP synthase (glutamine-hydrolysing)
MHMVPPHWRRSECDYKATARVTKRKLDLLRQVDPVYLDECAGPASTTRSAKRSPCCCRCDLACGRRPPLRSGSTRYRAVTSTDGTTANYYSFQHTFVGRVANRIMELRGIPWLPYDITA